MSLQELLQPFPFHDLQGTDVILGFFLFAFVGWAGECLFARVVQKKWVNRGFLLGPICPIYGAGAMSMILILLPIQNRLNIFSLFIVGAIICSILEYVTSYVMEKLWNLRWWDYTGKFNLNGRICLSASIVWGILCVFLIKIIAPIIFRLFHRIPDTVRIVLCVIFICIFISDFVNTVVRAAMLSHNIKTLSQLSQKLHEATESNREELQKKWNDLQESTKQKHFFKRINKAFPSIRSARFKDTFASLRERVTEHLPSLDGSKEKIKNIFQKDEDDTQSPE